MESVENVKKVYDSPPNLALLDLVAISGDILDVGCGTGENAKHIKEKSPNNLIDGITYSVSEMEVAKRHLRKCWLHDIENPFLHADKSYDVIVFSHILEHVRMPADVLLSYSSLLKESGVILIAVPNVLYWKMRIKFLCGNFDYSSEGILDDTHIRFFTFFNIEKNLCLNENRFRVLKKISDGSVPKIIPKIFKPLIKKWLISRWPNVFGNQIILLIDKEPANHPIMRKKYA